MYIMFWFGCRVPVRKSTRTTEHTLTRYTRKVDTLLAGKDPYIPFYEYACRVQWAIDYPSSRHRRISYTRGTGHSSFRLRPQAPLLPAHVAHGEMLLCARPEHLQAQLLHNGPFSCGEDNDFVHT